MYEAAPTTYAAQEYGGEQEATGYRRLSGNGCPVGTFDTSCGILKNRIVLWIAFALLFIPALYFFCIDPSGWEVQRSSNAAIAYSGNVYWRVSDEYQLHRIVAGTIVFIASLAYLTMSLGYGSTIRCCDGREFFYARYIDWTITTPLMLWEILDLSNAYYHERFFVYSIDIIMIIGGLIGALVCGGEKWAFFGFSILCFIPILGQLSASTPEYKHFNRNVFDQACNLIVVSWFFYPIVWILAEGTSTISANAEAILYTVLDIISKSALGWHFVSNPFAFSVKFQVGNQNIVANGSML